MKKSVDIFYKMNIILAAILSLAVFCGKAETETKRMLGQRNEDTVKADSLRDCIEKAFYIIKNNTVEFFSAS